MADRPRTSKRELLLRLLDAGKVMVQLDARREGVVVPEHLTGQSDLKLNLSYRFAGPMTVEADRVCAELSFSGHPFLCEVPFSAIYAMVSHTTHDFYFFPTEAPAEALAAVAEWMEAEHGAGGPPRQRPRLEAIDGGRLQEAPGGSGAGRRVGGSAGEDSGAPEGAGGPKGRPRAPHLRLLK
ncbi:MAG: stringent starvation protein B [Deltaproteobacteria bacterium]|nr:MAG: stringent starvation protein B [Deltaproteobacteria bacterium]